MMSGNGKPPKAHVPIEMLDFSPKGGDTGSDESGIKPISTDEQMNWMPAKPHSDPDRLPPARGGLFRKYVVMFVAIVTLALAINGVSDVWFSYHEQQDLLVRIQREQAKSAADKIGQFLNDITAGLAWETQLSLSDSTLDEWQFDAVRLFHQVPALTEIVQLDAMGREQYRMSREAPDVIASHADHSQEAAFIQALANKVYYGPVYFVDESQPYMTIAMAGIRPEFGVIVAQVNLTFIWDVISQIKVGKHGKAYVVDEATRLIAHPDISKVLRKTDMSGLAQVQAARLAESNGLPDQPLQGVDIRGRSVLSAYADVTPPGWLVFAELPIRRGLCPAIQFRLAFRNHNSGSARAGYFCRAVAGAPHGRADSRSTRRCRAHRQRRSRAAYFNQYRRRTRSAGRSIQRHGRPAAGILRRIWKARSKSAPASSKPPIKPSRASSRRPAMICVSRSMLWASSSRSCTAGCAPLSAARSSAASRRRFPR